jgi:hypothetical protein
VISQFADYEAEAETLVSKFSEITQKKFNHATPPFLLGRCLEFEHFSIIPVPVVIVRYLL